MADNASNMVASLRGLCGATEKDGLGCIAHLLNLVVKDLFEEGILKDIFDKTKACVHYLCSFGPKADLAEFVRICSDADQLPPVQKVINYSETRFAGFLLVVKRLCMIYVTASTYLSSTAHSLPSESELNAIDNLLGDISKMIDWFGSRFEVTVSAILPFTMELYERTLPSQRDSAVTLALRKALRDSLDKRLLLRVFDIDSKYLHAAWLDPRYIGRIKGFFNRINEIHNWKEGANPLGWTCFNSALASEVRLTDLSTDVSFLDRKRYFARFVDKVKLDIEDIFHGSTENVEEYLTALSKSSGLFANETDPLEFWKKKKNEPVQNCPPALFKIVQLLFCIMPASTESERSFKLMKQIMGENQTSMLSRTLILLHFIRSNRELLESISFAEFEREAEMGVIGVQHYEDSFFHENNCELPGAIYELMREMQRIPDLK